MATPANPSSIAIYKPLLNSIPNELVSRFEPAFVEYYNKYSAGRLATHQVPIEEFRARPSKYMISYGRQIIEQGKLKITEQKCQVDGAEITVRIFEPDVEIWGSGPRPTYVNFHGGGWVFGGLFTDNDFCKRLSHELGVVCFDVDYRLAPEHKFPIPVNDCWTAFNWVRDQKKEEFNLDLDRVAIGGISAGGHLSAIVAHMCRDNGIPLAFQMLGVPVCDLSIFTPTGQLRPDQPYDSYRELYHTQPLSAERMSYFHNHFLGIPRAKELDDDFRVSPILAKNFKGLAPALIITGEMDLLKDEGEAYGKKMNEGGSKAEVYMIKGACHLIAQLDDICEGGKEYNRVVLRALREGLKIEQNRS